MKQTEQQIVDPALLQQFMFHFQQVMQSLDLLASNIPAHTSADQQVTNINLKDKLLSLQTHILRNSFESERLVTELQQVCPIIYQEQLENIQKAIKQFKFKAANEYLEQWLNSLHD